MPTEKHIGIDLGGTNIRAGIFQHNNLVEIISAKLIANGDADEILQQVFNLTDKLFDENTQSIGIGVPGLVDAKNALVYDVVNIPSWQKIPLKAWLENKYKIPAFVENDANCFALGAYYLQQQNKCNSMAGLTIGTGLGTGLILDGKLYTGRNGGAGEFGMMPYLDHTYEYYASGQFFENVFNVNGLDIYEKACNGDKAALNKYLAFGKHLGNAIQVILFAIDVELIVIGGSVKHAFQFFEKSMWEQLQNFPYQRARKNLKIVVASFDHNAIGGAASLYKQLH